MTKPKHLSLNLIHSKLVIPNLPLLMVNFTIRNPPVPQLAIFVTGSNVIWVAQRNCSGCETKTVPLYDPLESKSYVQVHCAEEACINLGGTDDPTKCDPSNLCHYKARYASEGVAAKEELSFTTYMDGGVKRGSDSTIVMCHTIRDVQHIETNNYNGLFGLGFFPRSLVADFGSKFSYCISDLSDPDHNYSQLNFGEELVELKGDVANLDVNIGGIYSVFLERIMIGEEILSNISPHRAVLDTGTPLMRWAKNGLTVIGNKFRSILLEMGRKEVFDSSSPKDRFCFRGNIKDLIGFPRIALQFRGGGYMELTPTYLFSQESRRTFCLAMDESINNESSIIGLTPQQNHLLAYDLKESKLYIQSVSCFSVKK